MSGRLIPALRWADEHGSRDGCCIGCGRGALLPHTSDCPELADIIRRAKEDNAMPAEFDEKTPLGQVTVRATTPLAGFQARRNGEGRCLGCLRLEGEHHHGNCPELDAASLHDAGVRAQQQAGNESDRRAVAWERESQQRQMMGILGPGTAELVATKAKLEAMTAERDAAVAKNEDYSARLFAANGKIRELEADLEAESALADALLNGACAAPDHEMQYEDLFGAQSMAAATAAPQKSAAMGRAIGATIAGWRPVV